MLRISYFSGLCLTGWLLSWSSAHGQVVVKTPFSRVAVGYGVQVQAPFVHVQAAPPLGPVVPPPLPGIPGPIGPPIAIPAPPPSVLVTPPAMTLQDFARCFDPKPGQYEVVLLNPVNCQPTCVRFCLERCPRRVVVRKDEITFRYGLFHYVRIGFNCHGAVVSRH